MKVRCVDSIWSGCDNTYRGGRRSGKRKSFRG